MVVSLNPGARYWMDIFSHLFFVRIVMFVWKDINKQKIGRGWPILKNMHWFELIYLAHIIMNQNLAVICVTACSFYSIGPRKVVTASKYFFSNWLSVEPKHRILFSNLTAVQKYLIGILWILPFPINYLP